MDEIVIATRNSTLAMWQANAVKSALQKRFPGLEVRLAAMSTVGDRILDSPLSRIGDKGLFTKELESALYDGEAHIAVHSLKDMQTRLPDGLMLAAVTERHRPEDALVGPQGARLEDLRQGATVATGSLRRTAQLLRVRPDLHVVDIRGNLGTRLKKYEESDWDGMILAVAGLERLGFGDRIAEVIPVTTMIPAVGQGALGIEAREADTQVLAMLKEIEHAATRLCTNAERALLRQLEGGCQVPIGAHARLDGELLRLDAIIAALDGRTFVRDSIAGPAADGESLGIELAERLLASGGAAILHEVRVVS